MNNANIAELEAHGYKYIIGAKIKNESQEVKNWILEQPKRDCQMVEYDLTSSLKKHAFYNLLINNILYLCVT
ncbi:MAG: hypothetical protein MSA05_05175, partial [Prevotella sp.]|uniref:hypothetical protein n=1 Tax=Prevotella sp. TaxID=59823 RepID=UPI0025D4CBF7